MPAPSAHHLVVDNLHDLFSLRPRLCCGEVGGGGLDEGLAETNGGPQRMGAGKLGGKPGETMSFGMFLAMFPGAFWWICLQSAFWNELWLLGGTALKKSKKSPRTQGRNINQNPGDQTTVPHGNGKIELQTKKNTQSSVITNWKTFGFLPRVAPKVGTQKPPVLFAKWHAFRQWQRQV